jgi:hypothetical protein
MFARAQPLHFTRPRLHLSSFSSRLLPALARAPRGAAHRSGLDRAPSHRWNGPRESLGQRGARAPALPLRRSALVRHPARDTGDGARARPRELPSSPFLRARAGERRRPAQAGDSRNARRRDPRSGLLPERALPRHERGRRYHAYLGARGLSRAARAAPRRGGAHHLAPGRVRAGPRRGGFSRRRAELHRVARRSRAGHDARALVPDVALSHRARELSRSDALGGRELRRRGPLRRGGAPARSARQARGRVEAAPRVARGERRRTRGEDRRGGREQKPLRAHSPHLGLGRGEPARGRGVGGPLRAPRPGRSRADRAGAARAAAEQRRPLARRTAPLRRRHARAGPRRGRARHARRERPCDSARAALPRSRRARSVGAGRRRADAAGALPRWRDPRCGQLGGARVAPPHPLLRAARRARRRSRPAPRPGSRLHRRWALGGALG